MFWFSKCVHPSWSGSNWGALWWKPNITCTDSSRDLSNRLGTPELPGDSVHNQEIIQVDHTSHHSACSSEKLSLLSWLIKTLGTNNSQNRRHLNWYTLPSQRKCRFLIGAYIYTCGFPSQAVSLAPSPLITQVARYRVVPKSASDNSHDGLGAVCMQSLLPG